MIYYTYEQAKAVPMQMDIVLQKYFPTNEWGCNVLVNLEGVCELFEICKVEHDAIKRDRQIWTHYANIQWCDKDGWELNEQFKGEHENEMWIYGYFKTFGAAIRNLANKGTINRKPIKIY